MAASVIEIVLGRTIAQKRPAFLLGWAWAPTARRRGARDAGDALRYDRARSNIPRRKDAMADSPLSLPELEDRIAVVRDNLRQLVEQAAARSGAADEDLLSSRIAEQEEELKRLTEQRDKLTKAKR
jgi:hypothetical protein